MAFSPLAEVAAVLNRTFPFYGSCARLFNGFQSHLTDCAAVWSWISKLELFQMQTIPDPPFLSPKAPGARSSVLLGRVRDRAAVQECGEYVRQGSLSHPSVSR